MEKESAELEKRKAKVLKFLKHHQNYIQYIILVAILWLSYFIRTRNIPVLRDITTGKLMPADPDAVGILRYVYYILEHGKIMAVDMLRYYPLGFTGTEEFSVLSHSIVYLYKFLHFFNPAVTIEYADVIYPPVALVIGLIFFFLLVRKLSNYKIALISSGFLIVVPAFLFRTMAGVSDKEALGTMFMFMAFYFFVYSWNHSNLKKSITTSLLAGVLTALMGLVWGGVNFVFLVVGIFALVILLLNKSSEKRLYSYSTWLISSYLILMITFSSRFSIGTFLTSTTTSIALITLVTGWIDYLIFKRKMIKIKIGLNLPDIIKSFLITIVLGLIFLFVKQGPLFFINKVSDLYIHLVKPFATGRWVITVAESHQPYIQDWFTQFGKSYIWIVIIGSIILFHEIVKIVSKKESWKLTGAYSLFIFGFIFTRYSPSSLFNGETPISITLYIGSLILFCIVLIYSYLKLYKNKDSFERLKEVNESWIFILIWFIIMVVAARSAIRLLYIFAPITAIIFAYLVYRMFTWSSKINGKMYKAAAMLIIIVIVCSLFLGLYNVTLTQAKYSGTVYNQQWQVAMQWVRENTPENSVFAHWWDYGYLVQTGANRATLSDGGNARGAINHFIGRHVLTAQNSTEALELLKANEATHLLMISDEIGKYPAFSSIGSDAYYDRYSWISTFVLDTSNVRETRNGISYVYQGGAVLDEDLVYNGNVYPRKAAGFGAFIVETQSVEDNGTQIGINFMQPKGILVYNGQQVEVPINCIFFNNQALTFNNPDGIDACLRIIPVINGDQSNQIGAMLYLSPRVKRTLFTRLYLFNEEDENFRVAYSDENSIPLAIYNGRLIGPLKIWEVSYPDSLNIPEEYYGTEVLDSGVEKIKPEYA